MGNTIDIRSLKAKPILKEINGIEIYNIACKENEDRRKKLFNYIREIVENKIEEKKNSEDLSAKKEIEFGLPVDGYIMLKDLLPILTNVLLDELSDQELLEIMEEPEDDLLETCTIVSGIFKKACETFNEYINKPADELMALIPENKKAELLVQAKAEEKARKAERIKAEMEAKLAELDTEDNLVEVNFTEGE